MEAPEQVVSALVQPSAAGTEEPVTGGAFSPSSSVTAHTQPQRPDSPPSASNTSTATSESPSSHSTISWTTEATHGNVVSDNTITTKNNKCPFLSSRQPTKYLKLERIGRGGCGSVWLVERTADGKRFAAKVVPLSSSSKTNRRFALNEPLLLFKCTSPFVVKFEDYRVDQRRAVVTIMEWIQGVDLASHIRSVLFSTTSSTSSTLSSPFPLALGGTSPSAPPPSPPRAAHLMAVSSGSGCDEESSTIESPKVDTAATSTVGLDMGPVVMEPSTSPASSSDVCSKARSEDLSGVGHDARPLPGTYEKSSVAPFSPPPLNLTDFEIKVGQIFVQILLGVHHIHRQGILHRDLKTGNIFITSSGVVKVGDFGLSTMAAAPSCIVPTRPSSAVSGCGSLFLSDEAVGTPCYMAPELWCTEEMPPYSQKSDMFALGIILTELLTGKRPARQMPWELRASSSPAKGVESVKRSSPLMALAVALQAPDPIDRLSAEQALHEPVMRDACRRLMQHVESHGDVYASSSSSSSVMSELLLRCCAHS